MLEMELNLNTLQLFFWVYIIYCLSLGESSWKIFKKYFEKYLQMTKKSWNITQYQSNKQKALILGIFVFMILDFYF